MAQRPSPGGNRLQSDSMDFTTLARNHFHKFAQSIANGNIPNIPAQPVSTATTTTTAASVAPNPSTSAAAHPTTPKTNLTNDTAVVKLSSEAQNPTTAATPTVTPKKQEPIHAMPFKGPKVEKFDTAIFSGCKFVLLDQFILETPPKYEEVSGTFQWETCQDQHARCEEYIRKDCANKRVFLVSSGGLGAKVVPKIHDLPQLYAVYIYCSDVPSHMKWASNHSKVRMVCFDDKNYLVPQLALDVAQSNLEWAVELLKTGEKTKAKKKLDLALANVKKCADKLPYPDLTAEIERRIKECE